MSQTRQARLFTHTGLRFVLGREPGAFCIWDRTAGDSAAPAWRFPPTSEGWEQAWQAFARWEPSYEPLPQRGSRDGTLPPPPGGLAPATATGRRRSRPLPMAIAAALGLALIGVVAFLLVDRHSGSGGAPLPAGFVLHSDQSGGFAVGLPRSWQSEAPPSPRPDVKFEAHDVNPDLAPADQSGLAVVMVDLPSSEGLERFFQLNMQQLRADATLSAFTTRRLTLPAGPAYEIQYDHSAETAEFHDVAYLLVHAHRGYVLAFAVNRAEGATQLPVYRMIARTFRFLG